MMFWDWIAATVRGVSCFFSDIPAAVAPGHVAWFVFLRVLGVILIWLGVCIFLAIIHNAWRRRS